MGSIKQGNDAEGKVECDPEAMSKKKILNKMNNTKKKKKNDWGDHFIQTQFDDTCR